MLCRALLRRHAVARSAGSGSTGSSADALERLAASVAEKPELENPGFYKFRKGGEPHATDPDVVAALSGQRHGGARAREGGEGRAATTSTSASPRSSTSGRRSSRATCSSSFPRRSRVPLDEVEPVESIVRRFSGGAMSHGALSAEAHETIAIALNRLGGRSNSGRGRRGSGALPRRAQLEDQAGRVWPLRRHGRVRGVRRGAPDQDRAGLEARRGRPDPGAQGHRGDRAPARHTRPASSLISPPPHHDIYSIEDLAQLVFDLREVNPDADISVKLVSSSGVGVIAAGVAKAHADVVHVAGADGGTGREPAPVDQARGRSVGARARRDAAGARRERPSRPRARARRRRLQDRAATSSSPRCSAPTSSRSAPRSSSRRAA